MVRQIAHLIIPPREKRSATFRVYVAKPTTEEERERGLLFALFFIDYYHHRNEDIIDGILEELETRYYDPDVDPKDPEALLEETLRALNSTLAHLIENEQIFLNLNRFHGVIGTVRGRFVTFTHLSRMRAFLLHHGKDNTVRVIDVLNQAEGKKDDRKTPPVNRIFSHILTGELRVNDAMLFNTASLMDYISTETISHAAEVPPASKTLQLIRNALKEGGNTLGIGALMVRLAPDHEEEQKRTSRESLQFLSSTEETTRTFLSPSIVRNAFRNIGNVLQTGEHAIREILRIPPQAPRTAIVSTIAHWGLVAARAIGRVIVVITRSTTVVARSGISLIQHQTGWRATVRSLKKKARVGIDPLLQRTRGRLDGLSYKNKRLMIIVVVIALVFIGGIGILIIGKQREQASLAYQRSVTTIRERMTTGEASMIFKDEERTKSIYREALAMVEALPGRTKEQQATKIELTSTIETQLESLRHVQPLASVDVIQDFKTLDPAVDLGALIVIDRTAYVSHGSRPLLYKVNLENKQTLTLDASDIDVRNVRHFALQDKNSILLAFGNAGIAQLNISKGSVIPLDIQFSKEGTSLNDMSLYNKRLYILDKTNNQLWRHNATSSGFGVGTPWMKEDVSFRNAVAVAIDGSAWVTSTDGIRQYVNGGESQWRMQSIDPPNVRLRKMIIPATGATLFTLDEMGSRVIEVAKDTGKIIAQYPLPAEQVRDFSIDEKKKEIILLTNTQLMRLTYEKK